MKNLIKKNKIEHIYRFAFLEALFKEKARLIISLEGQMKFVADDNNKMQIGRMFDNLLFKDTNKCLMLLGNPGSGKTLAFHAIRMMLKDLVWFGNHEYLEKQLFNVVLTTEVVSDYQKGGTEAINKYKRGQWMFDDFGKELLEANYYGTTIKVMNDILAYRYDLWKNEGLKTFFTSNHPLVPATGKPNFIKDRYGDYIYDRLLEMCEVVILKGSSRRPKHNDRSSENKNHQ